MAIGFFSVPLFLCGNALFQGSGQKSNSRQRSRRVVTQALHIPNLLLMASLICTVASGWISLYLSHVSLVMSILSLSRVRVGLFHKPCHSH
ncbi:hypothetical protein Mapa_006735 [Marchantia paleacea]|nr:hypothetical protein Mapa_006735 [Marchantia paleacea]